MTRKVGIIGGGQLALYLCRAAKDLAVETVVLASDADCPAAQAADALIVGGADDVDAASELARRSDVVTFEIEGVSREVLEYLAARAAQGTLKVAPSPEIMLTLQNKVLQKQWLSRHGFPTADFQLIDGTPPDLDAVQARLGLPLVQKTAVGGYDGRGVQIIRGQAGLEQLWPAAGVLEAFVPHALELAVVTARAADGSQLSYSPVAMAFNAGANVLETVRSPAGVSQRIARMATSLAEEVVNSLEGIGVFAVEMFVTTQHELLINEISPRVHNSGHLTLEACETSQFSQHLRAVTGLAMGPVTQRRPAVMQNVLFTPELAELCRTDAHCVVSGDGSAFVHWYGKKEGRPMRKMGHVTALAADVAAAERLSVSVVKALPRVAGEVPA